jgi:spectinomycin phosphotransferase
VNPVALTAADDGPPDETTLRRALADGYGIEIAELTAEREGADATAWAYRGRAADGSGWFVKLRRAVRPWAVLVARHLRAAGLEEVVAAVPTRSGDPWLAVGEWTVLVAPLVEAPTALAAGLDLDGWRRLGRFATRLHAVELPPDLADLLPVEDFRPKATALARSLDERMATGPHPAADELAIGVARAWTERRTTILGLVDRLETIADGIRRARDGGRPDDLVLCHADLHTGNVLVGPGGRLAIVDWDELIRAPRERDLMFVRGAAIATVVTDEEADAFEAGYGPVEIDPRLIAYYRIDWAIQDVAGFADEVLSAGRSSALDRARAAGLFHGQFGPGNEVDTALAAAATLSP